MTGFSHVLREIGKPKEWVWSYKYYRNAIVLFDRDHNMEKISAELETHEISHYFLKFIPEASLPQPIKTI